MRTLIEQYRWLALITLIAISCSIDNKNHVAENDLQKKNLHGKVKSVIESTYDVVFNSENQITPDILKAKESFEFDPSGNLTKIVEFSSDDDTARIELMKYDNSGNMTSWIIDDTYKITHKIEYDSNGNEVKRIGLDGEGTQQWITLNYWESGLLKEDRRYRKGELSSQVFYSYDSLSNLINEDKYWYYNGDTSSSHYVYKYDVEGNKIVSAYYNSNWDLESKEEYDYAINGNVVQKRLYKQEYYLGKFANKYNIGGNKTEEIQYNSDDIPILILRYDYDENGSLVEEAAYYPDETLHIKWVYNIEYDKHNNWTEIQLYRQDRLNGELQAVEITYRDILYY